MRCPPHTRAHVLRPCARACLRVRMCAHASAPKHASPSCRRRPRVARLAGLHGGVGVQRRHRRVEHRVCHHVVRGMRRLSGRAARHYGQDALGRVVDAARAVVRGGTAEACARVCAQTFGPSDARASTCVGTAALTKDGVHICMYGYMHPSNLCVHYKYIYYRYMCTCVRDGYGRACGCTAYTAHVRAIARADDAAVAITCARVGTSAGIYSQRTRHVQIK
jgi:hypothetical protein